MDNQINPNDITAQQERDYQFQELQTKAQSTRIEIQQAVEKIENGDFSNFSNTELSDKEKNEITTKYWDLLDKLMNLEWSISLHNEQHWEFTHSIWWPEGTTLQDIMKVTIDGWEWVDPEITNQIYALRENMQDILERWNRLFDEISTIENRLKINRRVERETTPTSIETEKKDIFKLPIRSVKWIFEEEVERNLLIRLDERWDFRTNVLGLRSNWRILKRIYDENRSYINLSSDWHDDERFVNTMERLLAGGDSELDSVDLANFLIDSRKFIDAVRRRIKVEKNEEDENPKNKNKKILIEFLRDKFKEDEKLLWVLSDEQLIALVKVKIEKEYSKNKQELEEELTSLEKEKKYFETQETELDGINVEIDSLKDKKKLIESQLSKATSTQKPYIERQVFALEDKINSLEPKQKRLEQIYISGWKNNVLLKIWNNKNISNELSLNIDYLQMYLENFEKVISWENSDIKEEWDIKALNDIEDAINKIVNGVKVDGEKTIADVKREVTSKYSALESKQRAFINRMLDPNFTPEEKTQYDKEITKLREEFKLSVNEHGGYGLDAEIMTKIQEQETLIYNQLNILQRTFVAELADLRNNPTPARVRQFHQNPEVERLRQLHQTIGHFQNETHEREYLQFMYAGNPDLLNQVDHVAQFHSLVQAKTLQNAFGHPSDDFTPEWYRRTGRWMLKTMAEIKNKDATGVPKVMRTVLGGLGSMGYSTAKVATHYPAKWLGDLAGNTLGWMQKKSENPNWLARTCSNLLKFPIRVLSVPAYVVLKPAEKVLKGVADVVGGELSTEGVTAGHLDNFIRNMAGREDVNTLWDAVFALGTHAVGVPCEFADKKTTDEKRDALRKYFQGTDPSEAISRLQGLSTSSQARSFWHGVY